MKDTITEELKPGKELNALVAEARGIGMHPVMNFLFGQTVRADKDYSTSWDCMELVEEVDDWDICKNSSGARDEKVSCFMKLKDEETIKCADTIPHAVCLAYLEVKINEARK